MKRLFIFTAFIIIFGCSTATNNEEIVIWNQMRAEGRAILQKYMDEFAEKHPGLVVRQTFYDTEELRSNFIFSALGKSGPDLIFGPSDNIGPYAEIDIIHHLEELFPETFFNQFVKDAQVWRRVRGQRHMFSIADRIGNHLALVYNKKMVKDPPKTMSELISMGEKLTKDFDGDGVPDQYALAWNYVEPYFMIPFLGSFGGWVLDINENPSLDSKAMQRAAQFILDLRTKYKIIPSYCDYDIANSLFKQGRAAMVIDGPWAWAEYGRAGIDYGITRIPLNDETGLWPTPMVSPLGWSVNINVKGQKLELVKELLRFLMRKQVQLEYTDILNTIPTSKEALADSSFLKNKIVQESLYARQVGRMMPTTPKLRGIWNAMKPAYQGIINGVMTPKEAAQKMQRDAMKFVHEMYEEY